MHTTCAHTRPPGCALDVGGEDTTPTHSPDNLRHRASRQGAQPCSFAPVHGLGHQRSAELRRGVKETSLVICTPRRTVSVTWRAVSKTPMRASSPRIVLLPRSSPSTCQSTRSPGGRRVSGVKPICKSAGCMLEPVTHLGHFIVHDEAGPVRERVRHNGGHGVRLIHLQPPRLICLPGQPQCDHLGRVMVGLGSGQVRAGFGLGSESRARVRSGVNR